VSQYQRDIFMCGIAGAIGFSDADEIATRIVQGLVHRGDCDDPVTAIGNGSALATRRLRILDWQRAAQPQYSFDGRIAVAMNGEIYNYVELRDGLRKQGIRFKTDCDTEVVANLLAKWGPGAIQELNGMFSFVAISVDGEYWVARDHFGIKPLYFMRVCGGIAFSSEIRPLLAAFPDKDAVAEEFPPSTFWHNNRRLPYTPRTNSPKPSRNLRDNAKRLDNLLQQAVERRLPRDLPCAVLFGGGIDSTLILHYAHRLNREARPYFIGTRFGSDYEHATRFALEHGLNLRKVPVTPQQALNVLEKVVRAVETFEPNVIRNAVFSYLLSEAVHKDGIRVALCGEGADELFCGYPEMGAALIETQSDASVRTIRNRFLGDLCRTQLLRVDRCSMIHTVETREPFLDCDVVAFANGLPLKQLVSGAGAHENKLILRDIYSLYPKLSSEIAHRRKVVFVEGVGMGDNSRSGPFYDYAEQHLTENDFHQLKASFRGFQLNTKEEALYLFWLSQDLDVRRVRFLKHRPAANCSAFST